MGKEPGHPVSRRSGQFVWLALVQHRVSLPVVVVGPEGVVQVQTRTHELHRGHGHEGGAVAAGLEESLYRVLHVESHVATADPFLRLRGDLPLAGRKLRHQWAHFHPHGLKDVSQVAEEVLVLRPDPDIPALHVLPTQMLQRTFLEHVELVLEGWLEEQTVPVAQGV